MENSPTSMKHYLTDSIHLILCLFCMLLFFAGYLLSAYVASHAVYAIVMCLGLAGLIFLTVFQPIKPDHSTFHPVWLKNRGLFFLTTLAMYMLAKYISLLFHEWSHALWANVLGVRTGSIFAIHYGSNWTLADIYAVDGGGFYDQLFGSGQYFTIALVAFAGPLTNIILAVAALILLLWPGIKNYRLIAYFLFWTACFNLAQLWSYFPLRTVFYHSGDIINVCKALALSPVFPFLIGTGVLAVAFAYLFIRIYPRVTAIMSLSPQQALGVLALAWGTVFLYFGTLPVILSIDTFLDIRMSFVALDLLIGTVILWIMHRKGLLSV